MNKIKVCVLLFNCFVLDTKPVSDCINFVSNTKQKENVVYLKIAVVKDMATKEAKT